MPAEQPRPCRRQSWAEGRRRLFALAGRAMVPVFILVPQVTMRKRLDIDSAARRWQAALPRLVLANWQA